MIKSLRSKDTDCLFQDCPVSPFRIIERAARRKLEPNTPEKVYVALGISQNKLARDLDVPVTRINDIIHFRRGINATFPLRLGKYLKTNAEFWIIL